MRLPMTLLCIASVGCFSACESNRAVPSTAPTPVPSPSARPQLSRQLTIAGLVREVNGGPLADAAIYAYAHGRQTTPPVASTAADGSFRLDHFADDGLAFRMNGYESGWWTVPQSAGPNDTLTVTIKMQQTLRVPLGSTISSILTADDLTYRGEDEYPFWSGDYLCSPCKFISVSGTQAGATLRLSWSGGSPLTVWGGDAYQGPVVQVRGEPGAAELVISAPPANGTSFLNTLMVGLDRKRDPSEVLNGIVTFTLAAEGRQ
jgi:hypothetical protein